MLLLHRQIKLFYSPLAQTVGDVRALEDQVANIWPQILHRYAFPQDIFLYIFFFYSSSV